MTSKCCCVSCHSTIRADLQSAHPSQHSCRPPSNLERYCAHVWVQQHYAIRPPTRETKNESTIQFLVPGEELQELNPERNRVHIGSKEFEHLQEYDMDEICARVCVVAHKPDEKQLQEQSSAHKPEERQRQEEPKDGSTTNVDEVTIVSPSACSIP